MVSDLFQLPDGEMLSSILATASAKSAPERSQIAVADLESMLIFTDAALDVLLKNEGKLSAMEIRLRNLLAVVRTQIAEELIGNADDAA
jgi:hypothetical protein